MRSATPEAHKIFDTKNTKEAKATKSPTTIARAGWNRLDLFVSFAFLCVLRDKCFSGRAATA